MLTHLRSADLVDLALGSALLAAGGGGMELRPVMTQLLHHRLRDRAPLPLVRADDLDPDGLVVHVGAIGTPVVAAEQLLDPADLARAAMAVTEQLARPMHAVGPLAVGGVNVLSSVLAAAELGLPLVDGDLMGRTFPSVLQNVLAANGVPPVPMAVAGGSGDAVLVQGCRSAAIDRLLVGLTGAMGGVAALAAYPVHACQLARLGVAGSVRRACELGAAFTAARTAEPAVLAGELDAELLAVGRVDERTLRTPTAPGSFTLESSVDKAVVRIDVDDEFLAVTCDGELRACVPNVVTLLDERTRTPLSTNQVRVGQTAIVLLMPALLEWPAPARPLVGPGAWRLDLPGVADR